MGTGGKWKKNLKSFFAVVLFAYVSCYCNFEGIGGLNVTDVSEHRRRKALVSGFSFSMGIQKSMCQPKN